MRGVAQDAPKGKLGRAQVRAEGQDFSLTVYGKKDFVHPSRRKFAFIRRLATDQEQT
ncbi:hypothetical protein [Neomegalonema sp.]|uniref:hypothetical protein n=1 Tax=Neomegalonema sp. TaxID=2039713 RepID=UPI00262A1F28|nr:hypothetical protein [Neomegalonema sp.]MDD2868247.1 hypothetical protein [Neomegalonema sp.]